MAPEIIKQKGHSNKVDIWALGCTFIEMATAKPPYYQFNNPISAMYYIAKNEKPPDIPQHLSNSAINFIQSCLQINPEDRADVDYLLNHNFITGKTSISNTPLQSLYLKQSLSQFSNKNSTQQNDNQTFD